MAKKLSIIIPAYKVDGYIEKCIRSLSNQDLAKEEYEIIVTNDGSPDRCREIVEGLQQEFSNLILINQENQGVSMARNNAISKATGEYILPIDPDDYVLPNVLGTVYDNAKSRNLDVLYLAYEIFDREGNSIWETDYEAKDDTIFDGVDGYFAPRGVQTRDPDRSWAMLYRLEMLREYEINYPKNVPFLEDGLFIGKVFIAAKRVGFLSAKFYQRTTRMGSATNSGLFFSENAMNGFVIAIKDVENFAAQNNLNAEQRHLVNHIVAKFVLLAITPSALRFNFKEYFKALKVLKKANINKIELDGLRFLYKRHMMVFNASKLLFPFYFKLKNK